MKPLLTILFCFGFLFSIAQGEQSILKPADLVASGIESGTQFSSVIPFTLAAQNRDMVPEFDQIGTDYDLLNVDRGVLADLTTNRPEAIELRIPSRVRRSTVDLELVKVDIFTDDFVVTLGSDNSIADVPMGAHYRGIIKGDPGSVVAISIFEDEIMGLIASDEGNLVLGKMRGESFGGRHILYDDQKVLEAGFECGTLDDGIGYKQKDLDFDETSRDVGDCIRLYIEVDNDIYNNKGGVTGTTNYVTGLLNEVITLYANESISAVVSQILVWDTSSPYSSTSSSGMLSDFQTNTGSFNGDLAQLLSYQASGGIAAGFSGICNPNPDNSKSFSSINSTYSNVPTYSWSVMVVTHEFGHLWGSRHTHACVWNGNNTAIDGCAGQTEGTCPLPGYPSQGGTLMSYCHLQSVGINFNEGFGPQPGNVIRNSVANASCTSPCGPPTCDDGIQNQDETGVDCGGSTCPPCPTCDDGVQNGEELGVDCGGPDCDPCPCTGQDLTLTLVFDNYPEETTWEITAGSLTYASGGPYGSEPDGSTLIEIFCMNDGCYDFTIYDSYGDGICCAYGNGSYTLEDQDGNVLASGGAFSSAQTTNFCITSGPETLSVSAGSTDISCNGANDGTATATPTGGTPPYTFSWTGPNNYSGAGASISGLEAGTYTVEVTDADLNTATDVTSVSEPAALTISPSSTDVSCGGTDDGTASANPGGGTSPYTFAWTGPGGYTGSGETISGLAPGTYNVTATDANGCAVAGGTTVNDNNNTFYADSDSDGYGDPNNTTRDCTQPNGYVTDNTDCDDGAGAVNPGAIEVCDGIDNNCDGQVDEGFTQETYYADNDGDTYGDPNVTQTACAQPAGYVTDNTDCDDSDTNVNPGATEVCDGVDNDCNGQIDDVPGGCQPPCETVTDDFPDNPLTHTGSGSSSTTLSYGLPLHEDPSFTISGIDDKLNGKASRRYIEIVTVEYNDGTNTYTYGTYSGSNVSSANVSITGTVSWIMVTLEDGLTGATESTMSIDFGQVSSCGDGGGGCPDADGDGVCDADDQCPGWDDSLLGAPCDDGDACTENDVYVDCDLCAGTFADADGDGVCDADDVCPGFDDTQDSDGDGIPDGCDTDCTPASNNFPDDPLTHSGNGSSSTTLDFGTLHQDVIFTITGLGAKTNGNPNGRWIEFVTVVYDDGTGTQTYGTFSGDNTSTANVNISGPLYSVTITLEDAWDGNAPVTLNVEPGNVSSCAIPLLVEGDKKDASKGIEDVIVYPNPTSDLLNVGFHLGADMEVEILITDLNGVPVSEKSLNLKARMQQNVMDVSQMPAGVYFLHLQTDDQVVSRKFVILR